jgi:hypothetical protein
LSTRRSLFGKEEIDVCVFFKGGASYIFKEAGSAKKNKILPQVVVVVSFNGTWSARVICKRIEYLISLILFIYFLHQNLWGLFAFGSLPICQNVWWGFSQAKQKMFTFKFD